MAKSFDPLDVLCRNLRYALMEDYFPFEMVPFQGDMLILGRVHRLGRCLIHGYSPSPSVLR